MKVASRECHLSLKFGINSVSPVWMSPRAKMTSVDTCINPELKSKRFGSSILNSRVQKQPKSESRSNIGSGPKIPPSGLCTLGLVTGTLVDQRREKSEPRLQSWNGHNCLSLTSIVFCLSLIFAASLSNVTVASHNLHSFKKSGAYHKACLQTHGGVWMAQEHWLSEKQLPIMG